MKTLRYTLVTMEKEFPNDDVCLDFIFQKRNFSSLFFYESAMLNV
jgi:hypothetical protein